MDVQLRPNEAMLTGQEQIYHPRYFFLNAHDLSSLHLRSCTSLSTNGSTWHTALSDRQAYFISQRVLLTISGSISMLLDKGIVFPLFRSLCQPNIQELRNPGQNQAGG